VCIVYGMTETAPISFITRPDDDLERRVSTVGRAMPNVEAKVIDPTTGQAVPCGTAGEVCTRGYVVMRGYWDDPAATADAVDSGGWMHTGDLGVLDDEGYLNIVGRMRDMVIRGGENIYPGDRGSAVQHPPSVARR
jgi:fatty-acyl-CoA synthase